MENNIEEEEAFRDRIGSVLTTFSVAKVGMMLNLGLNLVLIFLGLKLNAKHFYRLATIYFMFKRLQQELNLVSFFLSLSSIFY